MESVGDPVGTSVRIGPDVGVPVSPGLSPPVQTLGSYLSTKEAATSDLKGTLWVYFSPEPSRFVR